MQPIRDTACPSLQVDEARATDLRVALSILNEAPIRGLAQPRWMPLEATMWESPVLVFISFFAFILGTTKVLSDNWTKRKLIEARVSEDIIRALFRKESDPEMFAALKWGIVLAALGMGLIVSQYLPSRFEEPLAWGVVLVFGGVGLLAYYATARAVIRREAGNHPERHRGIPDEHI